MSEDIPKIWKYRLGAFIIDLIFIFLITALFRNIIPFNVPVSLEYLAPFFSFQFYFVGLSLIKGKDYSFGKAALNISVQYSEDSEGYDLKRLFFRVLTIALIWPLNLQELPGKIFGGDFNEVFGIVLFSIQYSFIIYNIFLVLKTGKMLQDRLSDSYVIYSPLDSDESNSNPIEDDDTPFHKPIVIISLVLVIASLSFISNQTFKDSLLFETAKKSKVEKDFENLIYEDIGIRNRVNIWQSRVWTKVTENSSTTSTDEMVLNIEIWTPLINWNKDNRDAIINIINQNLTVDLEIYDSYNLKIWTGYGDLNMSYSFNGNFTPKSN